MRRRHCHSHRRSRYHHRSEQAREFKAKVKNRRQHGWSMNLYRNTKDGKIAGVCAGLADHFGIDPWVVRLIFLGGFFFFGGLTVIAYIAGWILLNPRDEYVEDEMEYDEEARAYRPKRMFKYSEAAGTRMKRAQDRLRRVNRQVEDIESYVTSRHYELDKEFAKIRD